MKTQRIISTLFFALLGTVLCAAVGFFNPLAAIGGALVAQVFHFFPVPTGILAFNIPATLEEARESRGKIREKKNKVETELKSFSEEKKGQKLTTDDDEKWNRMTNEALDYAGDLRKLDTHIEVFENMRDSQMEEMRIKINEKKEVKEDESQKRYSDAFFKFLKFGEKSLSQEELELIASKRAQSTTDSEGGYTIPTGFVNQLENAMLPYSGILQAATILRTATGNDLPFPTTNDTSNKGVQVDENPSAAISQQDVTFGAVTLKAWTFSSKIILISVQLLRDSAFNLEQHLLNVCGERLGRIYNEKGTTGAGTTTANGIVTAATASGVTAASTVITRDNIVDLMYSVNAAYRQVGAFMIGDATEKAIRKLSFGSSDDRPLWQAGIKDGIPDTIEGKSYYVNQDMSGPGASNTSMLFGDLKKYIVRIAQDNTMVVFREKYMDKLQVGYMAFSRMDANLLDAGTHPIKKLTHSAT